MSKLHLKLVILFSLIILVSPKAYANGTILKATTDNLSVASQQEFIIDLKLCGEGITSIDALFSLENSTAEFSAEISGNNDTLQIITKKEYDEGAKTAQITGGNPGGIIMDEDGCAILGDLTITATTTGIIVIAADFEESQALGGTPIDATEEISVENETMLEITVSDITETTAAETSEEVDDTEEEGVVHDTAAVALPAPANIQITVTSGSASITWEAVTDAQLYRIYYGEKSVYDTDNASLSTTDILGGETIGYTLPTLDPATEYIIFMNSTSPDGTEGDRSEAVMFTTNTLPVMDTITEITTTDEIIPALHDTAVVAPQPTAYIVQEPQQQPFTHTDTGPEHILIGGMAFVLIGWFYLRKKLA